MANMAYPNEVLENKIESILSTKVDMNSYITVDNSLAESAGMIKRINKYVGGGVVEDLDLGEGNTEINEVSYTTVPYTVGVTQGQFVYYDEQAMTDPTIVEAGLKAQAEGLVNDLTTKAFAELGNATLTQAIDANDVFGSIVDAIAKLNVEDESGLFILINPATKAMFRKSLGDDLKWSEGFARTGYIGSVCGVPVIVSKAVPTKTAFLATKEAVTAFVKKGAEIEQARDIDTRKNTVVIRKVAVVALTDATKVVKLTIA